MDPGYGDDHGIRDINISWYLDVEVLAEGVPVDGATLEIKNVNGTIVVSSVVNSFSRYTLPEKWYFGRGNLDTLVTLTEYSPYNISVTHGIETISQVVVFDESKTVTFEFGESCVSDGQLINAISDWNNGFLSISEVVSIIKEWKANSC